MERCLCSRLYNVKITSTIKEYAFSGSLCRIREFKTADGDESRFCLTVFSLSDYKHLHFAHDEYKLLIAKLNALLSSQAIYPITDKSIPMFVKEIPFNGDYKINIGRHSVIIGQVTASSLVKTNPFTGGDANQFMCERKWDICTCKNCPVFSRLICFETSVLRSHNHRKLVNVI